MSIKIDLLPAYVGLRRLFRRLMAAAGLLLGLVGAGLFVLFYRDKQLLDKLSKDVVNVETNATAAEQAKTNTDAATANAAPIETTVKFFVDAGKTGAERAALLDLVSHYIYADAPISSIDLSDGQTLKLQATVKSPEDYGNLLLKLRNGSATNGGPLFSEDPKSNSVIPSGLPGWPAVKPVIVIPTEQPEVLSFPLPVAINANLKYKVEIPSEPGGAAPAAAGGLGGPGGMPGMPGGPGMPPGAGGPPGAPGPRPAP